MCIPKENYVRLRYLIFVPKDCQYMNLNITTTKMPLKNHYYNYIKKVNREKINDFVKSPKNEINPNFEEIKEKIKKEYPIDNPTKDWRLKEYFRSTTTGAFYNRLWDEYNDLFKSPNLPPMYISLKNKNPCEWRIFLDILESNISNELKEQYLKFQEKSSTVLLLMSIEFYN